MSNPFEDLRQAVVVRPMNSPGPQGAAAPHMKVKYSADGTSWHNDPVETDRYLSFSTDNGITWSDAIYFNNLSETLDWVEKTRQWAENPENDEVEPGQYSALHHALQAKKSEITAAEYAIDAAGSAAEAFGAAAPAWDSATTYSYNDVVSFDNGHTYRCIGDNVTTPPNIDGVDDEINWTRITVAPDGFFELDENGDFMPKIAPVTGDHWMLDSNGDIMPQLIDGSGEPGTAQGGIFSLAGDESTLRNLVDGALGYPLFIVINSNIEIAASDLVIPENVSLLFIDGGKLTVSPAITVTINGRVQAGFWRIFDGQGIVDCTVLQNSVYPEWWGAVGDGVTDDTSAINETFVRAKNIRFRPKTYLVDPVANASPYLHAIRIYDNTNVFFEQGATLKAKPNDSTHYAIFLIFEASNILIHGKGKLVGERNMHIDTGGEHGHGVEIRGSHFITIEDLEVSDCWGDGIYIGSSSESFCEYINIRNVFCDNNRRNNLSIITLVHGHISNCYFSRANGTNPQLGMDIEPNYSTQRCQYITITGCAFVNNVNGGIAMNGMSGARVENIIFSNNFIINNNSGWYGLALQLTKNNNIQNNIITDYIERGIILLEGASENNIQGNTLRMSSSGSMYGIYISAGCNDNFVTNNDLKDSGTTPLLDNGTGTITVAGNRI